MERPYVLTLIVYERERRALGSLLAPSARGAASRSSRRRRRRRPESLPAQLRPPGSASEPPGTVTAGPGRVGGSGPAGCVCVCISGCRRPRAVLRWGPCGLGDPGRLRGARDSEAEGGAAAAGGGHAAERMGRPGRRCPGVPSHPPTPARSRASRPRGWGGGGWKRTVAASSARGEGGMGLRRPRPLRSGNGHVGDALRPAGDPALSHRARAHQTSPPHPQRVVGKEGRNEDQP